MKILQTQIIQEDIVSMMPIKNCINTVVYNPRQKSSIIYRTEKLPQNT